MMMAHQMKHMPSLPSLASALCHIATIAVVMRGRTDLGTAPGVETVYRQSYRPLLPAAASPTSTV